MRKIVWMDQMNLRPAQHDNVAAGHSSAKTASVQHPLPFAMELMIVVMGQMNRNVTYLVLNWNSSANQMVVAFWTGVYDIHDLG